MSLNIQLAIQYKSGRYLRTLITRFSQMMLNVHIYVSPHDACWTLATFLYSLALVLGHCISHQLTGTIAAPTGNEKL